MPVFQSEQTHRLIGALLRSHQERAALAHRMAEHEKASDRHALDEHFEVRARAYDDAAEMMKGLVRSGGQEGPRPAEGGG